jgi:hypothetical protein
MFRVLEPRAIMIPFLVNKSLKRGINDPVTHASIMIILNFTLPFKTLMMFLVIHDLSKVPPS